MSFCGNKCEEIITNSNITLKNYIIKSVLNELIYSNIKVTDDVYDYIYQRLDENDLDYENMIPHNVSTILYNQVIKEFGD